MTSLADVFEELHEKWLTPRNTRVNIIIFFYYARNATLVVSRMKARILSTNEVNGMHTTEAICHRTEEDLEWKKEHYGFGWMAESAFSAIKCMFGEHVKSMRWKNIVKEIVPKASMYNMLISMNQELEEHCSV